MNVRIFLCIILALALLPFSAESKAQSGWYVKHDGTGETRCLILTDSVQGTVCVHRLSVMCVQGANGYTGAAGSYGTPIQFPLWIDLYGNPLAPPTGRLNIRSLPTHDSLPADIGINNGAASPDWYLAAPYYGSDTCTSQSGTKGR